MAELRTMTDAEQIAVIDYNVLQGALIMEVRRMPMPNCNLIFCEVVFRGRDGEKHEWQCSFEAGEHALEIMRKF